MLHAHAVVPEHFMALTIYDCIVVSSFDLFVEPQFSTCIY